MVLTSLMSFNVNELIKTFLIKELLLADIYYRDSVIKYSSVCQQYAGKNPVL